MLTLDEILADVAISPGFKKVDEVGVNSRGNSGETPLHWMATLGDVQALNLLLDARSDINAIDNSGNTPLHDAVLSRQTPAASLLIKRGANAQCRNVAGLTPLDIAKSDGFAPLVLLLSR